MALQFLDNKYDEQVHQDKSFFGKLLGFLKTETVTNVGEHSLKADIDTSGIKLDISSLIRNELVTRQISDTLKNIK